MSDARKTVVVKVGGSLFDLPDLGVRLQRWMAQHADARFVVVPGGGATANVVRDWDRRQRLGETKAHWLALRALTMNAHFLAGVLPGSHVLQHLGGPLAVPYLSEVHDCGLVPIVDMYDFARDDEQHEGHLPHCWQVTSDSLAARVAERLHAQRLVLLKSVTIDLGIGWEEAVHRRFVDAYFPEMARRLAIGIDAINLRLEA